VLPDLYQHEIEGRLEQSLAQCQNQQPSGDNDHNDKIASTSAVSSSAYARGDRGISNLNVVELMQLYLPQQATDEHRARLNKKRSSKSASKQQIYVEDYISASSDTDTVLNQSETTNEIEQTTKETVIIVSDSESEVESESEDTNDESDIESKREFENNQTKTVVNAPVVRRQNDYRANHNLGKRKLH
jgi:hypothetical protein